MFLARVSGVKISIFRSAQDPHPQGLELSWPDLAILLGADGIPDAPCTVATCGKGEYEHVTYTRDGEEVRKGDCRNKYTTAWSPAAYRPGDRRGKANVGTVSLMVLDLDHLTEKALEEQTDRLERYAYIAHPSHSDGRHGSDDRCWRVILPLSEPVLGADWERFWLRITEDFGIALDRKCKDSARIYFTPMRRLDAPHSPTYVHEGATIDVREVLSRAPSEPTARELSVVGDLPPASPDLLDAVARRLADHGPGVKGQGRNNHSYAACAIALHSYALTEEEAYPVLASWNQTCVPPSDDATLRNLMVNASSYGQGARGGDRLEYERAKRLRDRLTTSQATVAPSAAVPLRLEDLVADVEPSEEDEETSAPLAPADWTAILRGEIPAEPAKQGFHGAIETAQLEIAAELGDEIERALEDLFPLFRPAAEVLREPSKPTPWLVRGLVKDGGVAMPGAGPKACKTWITLETAVAVASGTRAFGQDRFRVPRARAVAYFFAEDDADSVKAHIRALASGRGISPEELARNLYLCPMGPQVNLCRDQDLAWMLASAREIPSLGLLCMDPFRNLHSGEENDSNAMADVLGRLRFLARKLEATMMVPHHSKKMSREDLVGGIGMAGGALRGSSAIFGALDSTIMIARDETQGDEQHFVLDLRAIIKGAKSAGVFGLKLSIVDDERDQAKHAEWEYLSAKDKVVETVVEKYGEQEIKDNAVAVVDHMRWNELSGGKPLNVEKLRTAFGWGSGRFQAAIAHAQGKGWVHQPDNKWELTDLGRRAADGNPTKRSM